MQSERRAMDLFGGFYEVQRKLRQGIRNAFSEKYGTNLRNDGGEEMGYLDLSIETRLDEEYLRGIIGRDEGFVDSKTLEKLCMGNLRILCDEVLSIDVKQLSEEDRKYWAEAYPKEASVGVTEEGSELCQEDRPEFNKNTAINLWLMFKILLEVDEELEIRGVL
jgi:hypothetical protein